MARWRRGSSATTRSPTASSPPGKSAAARPIPRRGCGWPRAPSRRRRSSKGARYTPVAKRNDRPDGIAFLLRNYPQLTDAQIAKLMGTTKDTIQKVRDRYALEQPEH